MAIDTESLIRFGPEKHATVRQRPTACPRRCGRDMWLVTGQAGDGPGLRRLSERIEGRHITGLPGTSAWGWLAPSAVYQSDVRVIYVFRNAC